MGVLSLRCNGKSLMKQGTGYPNSVQHDTTLRMYSTFCRFTPRADPPVIYVLLLDLHRTFRTHPRQAAHRLAAGKSNDMRNHSIHVILTFFVAILTISGTGYSQQGEFIRTTTLQLRAAAPDFSEIGPVATNLWTFTAREVYDPQTKTDVFYLTSFNSASRGQLIRLDYRNNRAESWTLPVGIGSWGLRQGKDGNIYLGSYNGGELLCFDPRTEKWIPLPQLSEEFRKKEFVICDLAEAPDGDIYYGTYPGAHLVRYDPHAQTMTDLGKVANENYLRWLSVTPQGIVICGVGMSLGRVIAYNPQSRTFVTITPEAYQRPGDTARPIVTSSYILQPVPGNLLVYDVRSLKLLHVFPALKVQSFNPLDGDHVLYRASSSELNKFDLTTGKEALYCRLPTAVDGVRWLLTCSGDLFGFRIQSYLYYQRSASLITRHRIPVDGLGQNVLWLRSTPDGLIYGGPELGQTLFSYNPANHELRSYDQVIDPGGEIYYAVDYQNKLYSISYIRATLAVFDPSKPWDQGERPDSNPRQILSIPQDQWRPVGGIHLGPDGKMYIGTQPNYGMLGGALSVFDPATEKLEVHRNLVPNAEISAVATDAKYVYCGADPEGGGGSKPTATNTHFFVWDPGTGKMIFDQALETREVLGAIAAVNGHAYFVVNNQLMDYDSHARRLTVRHRFDRPRPVPLESLQAAQDGTLWAILGDELAHIFPARAEVQFFPATAGKATSGLTIGADGAIYFGCNTGVWILHPTSPRPPASFGQ
jgi:streptogramin lyase